MSNLNKTSEEVEDVLLNIVENHLQSSIRGDSSTLDAHLQSIETHSVADSATTLHCHFVKLDGNQRPKIADLSRFLANLVVEYAIPRDEIEKAKNHFIKTNSPELVNALKTKAKSLFVDILSNSGEGGEILLFALTERYLKIPQLICKMPLKTSSSVHYHGIDGIHAKIDTANNKLLLYWGESKLHQDVGGAASECFKTIINFLNSTGNPGERSYRDIGLIKDNVSLTDPNAQAAIMAILDEDNPLHNNIEYRAVCLVGFDFDHYPKKPMQKTIHEIEAAVKKEYIGWQKKIRQRVMKRKKQNLPYFVVDVLLLPFPDVESFRKEFVKQLKIS